MKLKRIKIKGFRSFNSELGMELNNLKNMNLIIGQNNVGKSNVFRALRRVISNLPDDLKGYHPEITKENLLNDIFKPGLNLEEISKSFEKTYCIEFNINKGKLESSDFWTASSNKFAIELEFNDEIILNFECILMNNRDSKMTLTALKDNNPIVISNVVKHLLSLVSSTIIIDEIRSYDTNTSLRTQDNETLLTDNFSLFLKENYFDSDLNLKSIPEIVEFNNILQSGISEILMDNYLVTIDSTITNY